jgi:purine-binding chemotaxis protein CheW
MNLIVEAPTRTSTSTPASGSTATRPAAAASKAPAAAPRAKAMAASAGEYLTFRLGEEEYGIDILRVQEIRNYEQPTRIANAPAFIKGVVNLRGVIVPIIDLRLKLGCAASDYTPFTVVIVLNVRGRVIGAVVDSVSDVLELPAEVIKPAPELNTQVDAGFITGIGTVKSGDDSQRMLILMDIEGLMSSADMGLVAAAA